MDYRRVVDTLLDTTGRHSLSLKWLVVTVVINDSGPLPEIMGLWVKHNTHSLSVATTA